ncbi:mitochondrial ribosomal protein subunit L20-domain-containing protein [Mycena olivaceomarginata]|nr:mitochondrial ribosomal protein subunit L20-domain-containing protein [Mycena olivaceomarginata]
MLRSIFTRGYATSQKKWPRPKPGTAERPAYHAPDPLLNNPQAVVTPLPDEDLTFIHRPPPTAPSPYSLTTNPVSPLLRPRQPKQDLPLPPPSRPRFAKDPLPRASAQTILEIKRLRALDSERYTCSVLAKKFQVTRGFVQSIAALKKSERRAKRRVQEAVAETAREKWSEKTTTLRLIKAKRRELW